VDPYIITLVLYLLAMLGIGWFFRGKIRSLDDFALMGRSAPAWLIAASISATWYGAGTVAGLPGGVYNSGIGQGFGMMAGAAFGYILMLKLAPKIARTKMVTIPDILEARYGLAARYLGMIGLLGTWAAYIGHNIVAIGWILDVGLGIPPKPWGILIGFGVVWLYTMLGGLYSVVWTDFAQALIIFFGVLTAIPVCFTAVGGAKAAADAVASLAPNQSFLNPLGSGAMAVVGWMLSLGGLAAVDPTSAQRLLAAKSPREAHKAAYAAVFMPFFFQLGIASLAVLGRILHPNLPNSEYILLYIAKYSLPWIIGAPLLAALVATVMSTADSALNICSVLVVNDIYKRLINPNVSEKKLVSLSRIMTTVWALFGLGLAFLLPGVLASMKVAYTIMAGVVCPCWLATFWWKRANKTGAVLGMALSLITVVWWSFWPPIPSIPAIIPTMGISILGLVVGTYLGEPPKPKDLELFWPEARSGAVS